MLLGPEATASVVLVGIGSVAFSNSTSRMSNAAAKANFATDAARRQFDAGLPVTQAELSCMRPWRSALPITRTN